MRPLQLPATSVTPHVTFEPARGDRPAWRFGSGGLEGHVTESCVASYLHMHWAGQPAAAARFAAAARAAAVVAA